ncbi:MAG: hypothetical protein WCD04_10165 [Terriglobia bacterium]
MRGKGQQVRFLFREDLGDGPRVVAGPSALMRDLVAPVEGLAIEIRQGGEGTGGEEAVPNILDGALHAAFFITPGRTTGSSGKVVVSREFQEAGVKVNGIAAALQDHAAEIVGLQVTGCSAPILKGVDVSEEKVFQALVEKELDP